MLVLLLGVGGLGLGIQFSALIAHLTTAVPADYAPDISGVSTATLQVGGALGVAAFGTMYFAVNAEAGTGPATRAFALITAALAVVALLGAVAAHEATKTRHPTAERVLQLR